LETKRVRRTKNVARQAILDAARAILIEEGLDAVRVQRVAGQVGVTDAAVHYHFGSHAGLIEALLRHCGQQLTGELETISAPDLRAVSRALQHAFNEGGAARILLWLTLGGFRPRGSGMLTGLVENLHADRVAQAKARGAHPPNISDTKHLVALLTAVHLAQAVFGEALLRAVDADADSAGQQRFLHWVTARIADLACVI
jgi:AcrR family transcriptional regulator